MTSATIEPTAQALDETQKLNTALGGPLNAVQKFGWFYFVYDGLILQRLITTTELNWLHTPLLGTGLWCRMIGSWRSCGNCQPGRIQNVPMLALGIKRKQPADGLGMQAGAWEMHSGLRHTYRLQTTQASNDLL